MCWDRFCFSLFRRIFFFSESLGEERGGDEVHVAETVGVAGAGDVGVQGCRHDCRAGSGVESCRVRMCRAELLRRPRGCLAMGKIYCGEIQ